MFTVCPKCALTLVVTAADLRIAQGYVRCGRCLNVFNALARLSEDRPGAAPATAAAPAESSVDAPAESPAQAPAESPAQASAESPAQASAESPAQASAESPAEASAPPPAESASDAEDTGEIEIELDAGSVLVTSVRAPTTAAEGAERETKLYEPGPSAPLASTSQPAPAATATAVAQANAPATATAPLPAEPPDAQQTNTAPEPPERAFEVASAAPHAHPAWALGAGVLALALALQIVNHYRDALAANSALIGPLSAVYSVLGVKIAPRWNIHAYDVRQLGASVTGAAAGEIVVRASIKNSARRAQPLPLLRVTLQDRFGNRIAARDVPPGDYLPSSVAPSSLLAAGGRVDATMTFVDPGPQAVGFEIDACLRQQSGAVACAYGP